MHQCGAKVLYGSHSVCRIIDIEMRKIDFSLVLNIPQEQVGQYIKEILEK